MSKTDNPEDIALIYPHQLFHGHPAVREARHALLVEEPLFFTQYPFHKKKLILHRASMQWYRQQLDITSDYIEYHQLGQSSRIFDWISESAERVHIVRPTDNWLSKRLERWSVDYALELIWHPSPLFYLDYSDLLLFKKCYQTVSKGKN